MNIESLKSFLKTGVDTANQYMMKFQIKLKENPARAFGDSITAIHQSTKLELYSYILDNIKNNDKLTIEDIKEYYLSELITCGRMPTRSTSPMSNLVDEERTVAIACLLEELS